MTYTEKGRPHRGRPPVMREEIKMGWDPQQYLKFAQQRERPCRDLLARLTGPFERILDLGCGPGNSTALLAERFSQAEILGLDPDGRMLEKARRDHPTLRFLQGSAPADLVRLGEFDLVFSNACIHWIEDQQGLVRAIASALRPGGIFAAQLPLTGEAPFYRLLFRMIERDWPQLQEIHNFHALDAAGYYNALIRQFDEVELWRTDYCHVVKREQVLEWYRGSGLRPYLDRLTQAQREQFLAQIEKEIEQAYPLLADGQVFLVMPRLFLLART